MISHSIKKISFHLILIFGLLEAITVPLVAWLPQVSALQTKSPWQGAVVGFLGIIILFFIVNQFISKLKIQINDETVIKVSILPAAIWNTLLLALIFGIQKIVGEIVIESWILRYMLAGFVSVFGAVVITLAIYQMSYNKIKFLRISITTRLHNYSIKTISITIIALLGGIYEAIALPIILIWQKAQVNVPLIAAITGFTGGVFACFLVVIFYNYLKTPRLSVSFEK